MGSPKVSTKVLGPTGLQDCWVPDPKTQSSLLVDKGVVAESTMRLGLRASANEVLACFGRDRTAVTSSSIHDD